MSFNLIIYVAQIIHVENAIRPSQSVREMTDFIVVNAILSLQITHALPISCLIEFLHLLKKC